MRTTRILLVPATALLLASLVACSGDGTDSSTTTTTTDGATTSASPSHEASTSATPGDDGTDTSSAAAGCAATDATVPDGAATGPTADLDGDGRADELWLADSSDGGTRTLGVRTASGAVFSTDFTSSAPQAATALGQVLGDGTAIVLLDTGRAVPLYAVIDCALVATQNEQGEQYTFDKGFTGYGTGVGCVDGDDGPSLVGYLAETEGEETDVTTTQIELSDGGASASNGQESVERSLPADDSRVTAATSVSCGDAEAVHEPES